MNLKTDIRTLPYYERSLLMGLLIGVASGVAITIFHLLTDLFTFAILTEITGIVPPTPLGEETIAFPSPSRMFPLLLPLSLGLGGLMVGIILHFFPDIKGSGTDYSISSYHNSRTLKWYLAPLKLIASAITLGSGGSAGDEGPSAMISAVLGNSITRFLGMSFEDRRRAIAIGIGTGIGIVFKSPIAGALLSAEILYRRDLEPDIIFPSLVSSSVGYAIYGYFTGYSPLLGEYDIPFNPIRLPLYALVGVLIGLLSIVYVRTFNFIRKWFSRIPLGISPFFGGVLAGGIAILFPEVIGKGYGWIDIAELEELSRFTSSVPLLVLLILLPFAKIMATDLTVGSGGSGGIFAPGLVIGSFAGLDIGILFNHLIPSVVPYVAPFVIIGMVSFLAGSVKVPLSSIILVTEITDSLQLIPGTMIAVALSFLISGKYSLIEGLPESRKDSPVHMAEFETPLLEKIKVRYCELDDQSFVKVTDTMEKALSLMNENDLRSLPVVDEDMNFVGVVYSRDFKGSVKDSLVKGSPIIDPDSTLEHAWEIMVMSRSTSIPVVEHGKLKGLLTFSSMLKKYKEEEKKITDDGKMA